MMRLRARYICCRMSERNRADAGDDACVLSPSSMRSRKCNKNANTMLPPCGKSPCTTLSTM